MARESAEGQERVEDNRDESRTHALRPATIGVLVADLCPTALITTGTTVFKETGKTVGVSERNDASMYAPDQKRDSSPPPV